MDINKHNRLETYATKAIRYWTSNDIIDWLKTKGPFWKYEKTVDKGYWVDARGQDLDEELKWNN